LKLGEKQVDRAKQALNLSQFIEESIDTKHTPGGQKRRQNKSLLVFQGREAR